MSAAVRAGPPRARGRGRSAPRAAYLDGGRCGPCGCRWVEMYGAVAVRGAQAYGVRRGQRYEGQSLGRLPLRRSGRGCRYVDPGVPEYDGDRHLGGEDQHALPRRHQVRGGQGEGPLVAPRAQGHVHRHQRARVRSDGDRHPVHDRRSRPGPRSEVRYGEELAAPVESQGRRRRAGREVGGEGRVRDGRGGEGQARAQGVDDAGEDLGLGVLGAFGAGGGDVAAEVVAVAHEVAGPAPVPGGRGVSEVPAGGLEVGGDQRGTTGQEAAQGAVAAVGLGDQQRQAALRQQLGVAPHFGFDVR